MIISLTFLTPSDYRFYIKIPRVSDLWRVSIWCSHCNEFEDKGLLGCETVLSAGLLPAFYLVLRYTDWDLTSRLHGCSNLGRRVALRTNFYTVAANIFGIIFVVTIHYIQKCVSVLVH
jgi:hypothetical protein